MSGRQPQLTVQWVVLAVLCCDQTRDNQKEGREEGGEEEFILPHILKAQPIVIRTGTLWGGDRRKLVTSCHD